MQHRVALFLPRTELCQSPKLNLIGKVLCMLSLAQVLITFRVQVAMQQRLLPLTDHCLSSSNTRGTLHALHVIHAPQAQQLQTLKQHRIVQNRKERGTCCYEASSASMVSAHQVPSLLEQYMRRRSNKHGPSAPTGPSRAPTAASAWTPALSGFFLKTSACQCMII